MSHWQNVCCSFRALRLLERYFLYKVLLEFISWMHNFPSSVKSVQCGAVSNKWAVEVLPVSLPSLPIKVMGRWSNAREEFLRQKRSRG